MNDQAAHDLEEEIAIRIEKLFKVVERSTAQDARLNELMALQSWVNGRRESLKLPAG